jgi:hypothetical protein
LTIGQEGAQDESLSHRAFTGGTGARIQHFLHYLGITRSYLFLNTFVYTIFGQYGSSLHWLAQNADSPIVQHRHEILDYALARNDVHLVIAVGRAAKETIVSWVTSHGGTCPAGTNDVSQCSGAHLDPRTKVVGVRHPGGGTSSSAIALIQADFQRAADLVRGWMDAEPSWLPPDDGGTRGFDQPFEYERAAIPFQDFPYGASLRLGRGGTSSNRKDDQRSIQIFSAGGEYNARGAKLHYDDLAHGTPEGYAGESADLPYEPPKRFYRDYDKGPGRRFAQLLMGGQPCLEWPDFGAIGATAHPSLGTGPIYRGRPAQAHVLVLADQQSHDDLFTGRALCGDAGQHLQTFLKAIGIVRAYVILRVLPIDCLDLQPATLATIVGHPQVVAVYQAIVDEIRSGSQDLGLALMVGPQSASLAGHLSLGDLPTIALKAWTESGALDDWRGQLPAIQQIPYTREIADPAFQYDGHRGQIPRIDLPHGTVRWIGTSGDRGRRAWDLEAQAPSPDYYKLFVPDWVYQLEPRSLSSEEQEAIDKAPGP